MEPLEYIDAFENLFGVAVRIKSLHDRVKSNKQTSAVLVSIVSPQWEPNIWSR